MREWKESVAAKREFYVAPYGVEEALCMVCRLTKTVQRLLVSEKHWPVCTHCFSKFLEHPAGGRFESACAELHTIHEEYQGRIGGEGPDPMADVVARWKALAGTAFVDWLRMEQVGCNPPT